MIKKLFRSLAIRLVKRWLIKRPAFLVGDIVTPLHNPTKYEVASIAYNEELEPIVFIHDEDGRLYGVDHQQYKSIYRSTK